MSVAVIVVNYNAGDWLLRSVQSAAQEPLVNSVTIVDNASKDNSLLRVKDWISSVDGSANNKYDRANAKKIGIIENPKNVGFGKANNQVLQVFLDQDDSDYALLLNPDCELSAEALPAMLPYFQQPQNQRLGMASCVIKNTDGSIQSTCRRNFPTPLTAFLRMSQLYRFECFGFGKRHDFDLGSQPLPPSFVDVEAISGAFMLVRMSAVKEVGLFDEAYFMHCEDLDWCKRFAQKGWRVGFVPEVAVLHEKGISSKTRRIGVLLNLHQGMLRFFDKFYRNQYSLPFRLLVKGGIVLSFVVRATVSLFKGLWIK